MITEKPSVSPPYVLAEFLNYAYVYDEYRGSDVAIIGKTDGLYIVLIQRKHSYPYITSRLEESLEYLMAKKKKQGFWSALRRKLRTLGKM